MNINFNTSQAQFINLDHFEAMAPRNIGPAGMSGRVTAIDVDLKDPNRIFVGTASGGVWMSEGGGIDWKPVFDEVDCQSIGAIAINQQNPAEIWAGTGEGNPRNSHNSGIGIFKSIDGGKTWKSMGLENTKLIHRIRINPLNPKEVYVAALGSAWGPNPDRGVFKTTDGGKTWENILSVNDSTGCADLVMDPQNPNKLIASMWEFGRKPWKFKSGGKGSGLYITYDGGENWKELSEKEGLPKGELGRIGLAISPSEPDIIYALIEAKENAVYKSIDGGEHWSKISEDPIAGNRPFYYSELYVDPSNENRVYSLWTNVSRSEDGGKTWENLLPFKWNSGVHPDHHAFWIHPENPEFIIDGNDGGLNFSYDKGKTWRFVENLPVGQFYHINIDNSIPYQVGGGLQDNGSWVGPSDVWQNGGIRNHHFQEVAFGDGFDVVFRPDDPRFVYAMSQGGNVSYIDSKTGKSTYIQPVHPDRIDLRFNWNAAIAQNPFSNCGVYFGSQFVHKSYDCGKTWEVISPDLTTNDSIKLKESRSSGGLTPDVTAAENHLTILAISPSPLDSNVIWAGTDDGQLHLTKDGGNTWTELSSKLPGFKKGSWIPQIEVSSHVAGEAFVVVNDYRRNDFSPFLYHTKDFGKTWKRLANNDSVDGYCRAVKQDPEVPNLLFLGTDHGLFFSFNYGKEWQKWNKKFPSVPVSDLKIQERSHDLVIGTFGRAIWIMDDIRPLRNLAKENELSDLQLFPARDGYQVSTKGVDALRFSAEAYYTAPTSYRGVTIPVFKKANKKKEEEAKEEDTDNKDKEGDSKSDKKKKKDEKLKIIILSPTGDTIRNYTSKLDTGLNLVRWGMETNGVEFPSRRDRKKDEDPPSGPRAFPGLYQIHVAMDDWKDSTNVELHSDPRLPYNFQDQKAEAEAREGVYALAKKAAAAYDRLKSAKKSIQIINSNMKVAQDTSAENVLKLGKDISKKIDSLDLMFFQKQDQKGITYDEPNLNSKLWRAITYINNSDGPPTPSAEVKIKELEVELEKVEKAISDFFENDWSEYREKVKTVKVDWFDLKEE
ncbi:MAG: hypothetical protein R2879_10815 [Saprospiraceae bacterium]